jgi:hypothetical protein
VGLFAESRKNPEKRFANVAFSARRSLLFKTIVIASLAAGAAFAIAVGCSSPDPGGYVKSGGSRADDDDDKAPTKSSSSSSGGSTVQADCTKLPPADKDPKCDTCARSKCCSEYAACENSSACQQQKKCVEACADGDFACLLTCRGSSDPAAALADEFAGCINEKCSSECAGAQPHVDGGSDDPFGDF